MLEEHDVIHADSDSKYALPYLSEMKFPYTLVYRYFHISVFIINYTELMLCFSYTLNHSVNFSIRFIITLCITY